MSAMRPAGSRAVLDLAVVAAATVAVFVIASRLELYEGFSRWVESYEFLQADELPAALLALAIGLAGYAWRRTLEARRLAAERQQAEARVAELSQRLIELQEHERRTLARELHDELGQTCNAIRVEAGYIMNADASDRDSIAAAARRIADAAEGLYTLVHDMLRRLRPAALDAVGLEGALQELCENWESQSGIACGFFPRGVPASLDDARRIAVYRIVQEALANVLRHAAASQVRIELHPDDAGRTLLLTIADDGRGLPATTRSAGLGLLGMHERVAALHGEIRFLSPGTGLRIEVCLPIVEPAQ